MRRFLVYAPASLAETETWLDTGFSKYHSAQSSPAEGESPDVMFGRLGEDDDKLFREICEVIPKVIVMISDTEVTLPVTLQEAFTLYCWHKAGRYYVVGTSLEQLFSEPKWVAYGDEGEFADSQYLKAVSDQVYRYLLADVFRETREWCGHTFSVLGHM